MIHLRPSYIGFMVSVFVFCPIAGQSAEGSRNDSQNMQNVLQVRGLSAGAGEDDPGILYILPWANAEPATASANRTQSKGTGTLAAVVPTRTGKPPAISRNVEPSCTGTNVACHAFRGPS